MDVKPLGRRVRKADVKVGMHVTCRQRVNAYYWHNGLCIRFEPGDIGTVIFVDLACVTQAYREPGGTATFVSVEFVKEGHTHRCALYYTNLVLVKE